MKTNLEMVPIFEAPNFLYLCRDPISLQPSGWILKYRVETVLAILSVVENLLPKHINRSKSIVHVLHAHLLIDNDAAWNGKENS